MTPERMAELVARWVRWYTRDLPPATAERRREEVDADLHDHIAHERDHGTPDRRIALSIAARMVRGMAADASWRSRTLARSTTRKDPTKMSTTTSRSVTRVALATAFVLMVPLVLMQFDDGTNWSVADFVFAGVLMVVAGTLLEVAVRRPGNVVLRIAAGVIGVAAVVLGESDDAPGLVGFGCLLIAAAIALSVRTALRSE